MPRETAEASTRINASVDKVYAYVADFPNHIEWNEQPQRMIPLQEGPIAVGSRYRTLESPPSNMPLKDRIMFTVMMPVMKRIHKFGDETIAEITALDANERVAWKAHLPSEKSGNMMQMSWEILVDERDGGTQVTQRATVDPPDTSPFKGMVNEEMAASLSAGIGQNLASLKRIMEAD